jgi:hypothetical protein
MTVRYLNFVNVHIRMKVMKLLKGVGNIRKSSFNLIKASIEFPNMNTMKLPVFVTLCQKKERIKQFDKGKIKYLCRSSRSYLLGTTDIF